MEGKLCEVLEESNQRSGGILWIFFTGRGPYPPFQMMCCGGCCGNKSNDFLPKGEKEAGGYWEGAVESQYNKRSNSDNMLTHFQ